MINDFWYRIGLPETMETLGDRMEQQQELKNYNKQMKNIALVTLIFKVLASLVSILIH